MQKITLDWLKEKEAYDDGYNAFKRLSGNKEYLTILDIQYKLQEEYLLRFIEITECAESLAILSKHRNIAVVRWVADNINTPKDTLTELSKHSDKFVVRDVARNSNTPKKVLTKLSKHDDEWVVCNAKRTLKELGV